MKPKGFSNLITKVQTTSS